MKRFLRYLLPAALALALLCGCGNQNKEPTPPPDLTGEWKQVGADNLNFYQIATISDNTIQCFWYVASDDTAYLYWSGTFTPPENGDEPYKWESQNHTELTKLSNWGLRDETKTFTYEKGQLQYNVAMGNMRIGVALEKEP